MSRRRVVSSQAPSAGAGSSPGGGLSPLPPPGCIADTLAVLKADLEGHEKRAAELRDLIAGRAVYATSGHAEPPFKSRAGRPPLDPADEQRAKNAEKQRRLAYSSLTPVELDPARR